MGTEHQLYLECYAETQRSFLGSSASTLKSMADRLFNSMRSMTVEPILSGEEYLVHCLDLEVALQTMNDWPGMSGSGGKQSV